MSDQPTQPTQPATPAPAAPAAAAPASAAGTATMTAPAPAAAAPPAAFPAPAAPTWGQGAAPVTPNKRKSTVMIGAAAASVLVLGGAFGVLNLTKHSAKHTTSTSVVGPTINPNNGPAPATPKPPATLPGPSTPTVVTLPPPTTVPTPTTSPNTPSTPTNGGGEQAVNQRISVAVPNGWSVAKAESGYVVLDADGAEFTVKSGTTSKDASQLATEWINGIQGVDDMTITGSGDESPPSANVVSGFSVSYEGVLATQQGSVEVEGLVFVYVNQDGLAVLTETFNRKGDFSNFVDDYRTMMQSVVSDL